MPHNLLRVKFFHARSRRIAEACLRVGSGLLVGPKEHGRKVQEGDQDEETFDASDE
jgi:hypothetical protein